MRKILAIFFRDVLSNRRNALALYIIIFPLLFGVIINMLTPGINDTTVNLVFIEDDNPQMVERLSDYAHVYLVEDLSDLEERVLRRDEVFGIVRDGDSQKVVAEGNETEGFDEFVKLMIVFDELDLDIEDSPSTLHSFGKTVPPLKQMLVNVAIMFTTVLGGMLISFNIIEEKVDRTIRAIHLSTVSRNMFILGKSMMGMLLPIYGTIAIVLTTGFGNINWAMITFLVLASTIITMLVGFFQGVSNDDVINAAASVKMLFLPLAAGPLALEMLADKWQWLIDWNPFYWSYLGTKQILSNEAEWLPILMYTGIIVVISGLVYLYLKPKIIKGLE